MSRRSGECRSRGPALLLSVFIGVLVLLAGCQTTDTTPPTVTLSSSSGTVTSATTITLDANASDDTAVTRVVFEQRHTPAPLSPQQTWTQIGEDTGFPYEQEVAVTSGDNGTLDFRATAYDAAGNSTTSATVSVTVAIPPDSGVTVEIDAGQGGIVQFRSANLTIPPNALSADANVTLSLVDPAEAFADDPLEYVSDGYMVTAEGLGGGNVDLTAPISLGIATDITTQQNYSSLLVAQVEPELPDFIQLYPSESQTEVRTDYQLLETVQWVVAVPLIVNPIPTEDNILQVPWYHQSGLPWCVPTSLTATVRYFDLNDSGGEPLNGLFGQTTGLANWQVAAVNDHPAASGAGYGQLANIGVTNVKFYLWDADQLVGPTTAVQGYYNDFQAYVTLVNTGLFGFTTRRPLAMIVDNWWHSVTVVGVDGDGFFYHDSNGHIARHLDWADFQDQASDWKTDSEGTLIYKDKLYTAVIYDGSPKPREERDGSIVIRRDDLHYTTSNDQTAWFEWDGEATHTYGYYFEDPTRAATSDSLDLGFAAHTGESFEYRYRIANVTGSTLTYTSVAELSGPSYGSNLQQRNHVVTVPPYSLSGYLEGSFASHPSVGAQHALFTVKLFGIHDGNLLQDVKIVRYQTHNPPDVTIHIPAEDATLYTDTPYVFDADAYSGFVSLCSSSSASWTSSKAGDPTWSGCQPTVTFATTGPRELILTVPDGQGFIGQDSVYIDVIEQPLQGPPIVSIIAPKPGNLLNAYEFSSLQGTATDPDGKTPLSYQWVVVDYPDTSPNAITIGTGATLRWRPDDDLTFNCGGRQVDLYLYVTDPDGQTGEAHIRIYILYPVC